MARYTQAPDLHHMTSEERAALQVGQHITASGARGRWMGQTSRGTDVAAWADNATRSPLGKRDYYAALRAYAKA